MIFVFIPAEIKEENTSADNKPNCKLESNERKDIKVEGMDSSVKGENIKNEPKVELGTDIETKKEKDSSSEIEENDDSEDEKKANENIIGIATRRSTRQSLKAKDEDIQDEERDENDKDAKEPESESLAAMRKKVAEPPPAVEPVPSESKTRWHVICSHLDDWINLAEWFKDSEVRCERALSKIIREDFLPVLPEIIEARVSHSLLLVFITMLKICYQSVFRHCIFLYARLKNGTYYGNTCGGRCPKGFRSLSQRVFIRSLSNLVNMLVGIISRPSDITSQIPPGTPELWPLNCPKTE